MSKTVTVCGYIVSYVELGDIIDSENHGRILLALKILIDRILDWAEIVDAFTG